MTLLKYKGYTGKAEIDFDSGVIAGEVIDLRDVITFEGDTPQEAAQAFHDSVDDYLAFCKEKNLAPEKPFSGRVLFRTTPARHRRIAEAAAAAGQSINTWIDDALSNSVRS